jgi:ketosteroid isomerase-like protein
MKNLIFVSILLFVFSSCAKQQVVDQEAEGEKLMEISRQWAKSENTEETLSYWAEDAILIAPGQPTLRGKEEIAKMIEETAQIPGFEINWEPEEVFVSKSGDLAYLIENNYFAMNDSLGNQVKTFNKAVTIWKKQADGTWKNVVDTWNEDPSITSLK